ncbi:MAG TPA: LysR family transcriptional regulator [Methylophilus sp.]
MHHQDLDLFIAVAEQSSLTAAAKALAVSPAVASATLKRLEKTLLTQLFVRTTRQMRLTPQGEAFLQHARQAQSALLAGIHALQQQREQIDGTLTVSVPSDLGRGWLMQAMLGFRQMHPALVIHMLASDAMSDLYKSSVDIAIRYRVPPDSGLIMRPLAPENHRVLCAAPSYLRRAGRPQTLASLAQHACVSYFLNDVQYQKWRFGQGAQQEVVNMQPHLVSNDGALVRQWAVMGEGIAYKSRLDVLEDLQQGRLELLLPQVETERAPLYFVMAQKMSQLPAAEALFDYLVAQLQSRSPY